MSLDVAHLEGRDPVALANVWVWLSLHPLLLVHGLTLETGGEELGLVVGLLLGMIVMVLQHGQRVLRTHEQVSRVGLNLDEILPRRETHGPLRISSVVVVVEGAPLSLHGGGHWTRGRGHEVGGSRGKVGLWD